MSIAKAHRRRPILAGLALCSALLLSASCLELVPSPYQDIGPLLAALTGTPAANNKFLAFTSTADGLESTGNGTWTTFTVSGPSNLAAVAVVGSGSSATLFGVDGTTNDTVWKSTDLGRTWTAVVLGRVPTEPYDDIAACGTNIMVVAGGAGAMETVASADGGTTWGSVLSIAGTAGEQVVDVACNSARFLVGVGAGTSQGLFRTDNLGASFVNTALGNVPQRSIATSSANAVALIAPQYTLKHSVDAGQSWCPACTTTFTGDTGAFAAFGNNTFLVAQHDGPGNTTCRFRTSATGADSTWSTASLAGTGCNVGANDNISFNTGAGGNGRFVTGGTRINFTPPDVIEVYHSEDNGSTWVRDTPATTATVLRAVVFVP